MEMNPHDKTDFLTDFEQEEPRFFLDDSDIFPCTTIGESMNQAKENDFLRKMKVGKVGFQYIKKSDNSRRHAIGTLNKDVMLKDGMNPNSRHDKEKYKKYAAFRNLFVYWDLEKHMWRCFDKRNFIKIGYK